MAIYRYTASADNTITNAFRSNLSGRGTGSNMGAADVLEAFYISGQTSSSSGLSSELSRILIQFDTDSIITDRNNELIPASGNVAWHLNLYNARHATTLPKDFKMVVKIVSSPWQEGHGLDMDEYTDQTYNGTGSNWIRRGAEGDGLGNWSSEGGDYTESSTSPAYIASFTDGTEDLSVDVSHLVENWIDGNSAAATATGLLNGASGITDFDELDFVLTDYEGTSFTFRFDKDSTATGTTVGTTATIGLQGLTTTEEIRNKIVSSIDAVSSLKIDASNGATTAQFILTMDAPGLAGNASGGNGGFDASGATGHLIVFSTFSGGRDNTTINYGFGVFLSSSFETGPKSYYTKKFFARSSEYFFKRPVLEARWDSSEKDRAGSFYLSSALAPAEDNLNKLYLYNYVRGQLTDIPNLADNLINVSLFSGSASNTAPAGDSADPLFLPVGGNVASTGDTGAQGGKISTGIYTASLAYASSSITTIFPVWNKSGVQYHTGSAISLKTFGSDNNANPNPEYVSKITNLKDSYSTSENARFRLYVREKNWNPTIYTVANSQIENYIIEDAYFKVFRIVDDLEVISYGTGSSISPEQTGSVGSYTRLSYDISGNYFDLDMHTLESGYAYGIKLAYYSNNRYDEQPEVFKFRVED